MKRRYYEEEMRYLQEAAAAFAEEHPEQARFLDVDSVSDRDPYVERLFEGFSFLSGRIHERLDNQMPEYTESLIQLLYPHFLKPVPALSIVEFEPKSGSVQETTVLDRGVEVQSEPVGDDEIQCRFTTTQEVRLQPMQLANAKLAYSGGDRSSVQLRFELNRSTSFEDLALDPLRLYFYADAATASTMHLFFTRHVSHVELSVPPSGHPTALRGQKWIQPVGTGDDEQLLPYAEGTFAGMRLLQEYLCFRRKFWFVDLHGLDRMEADDDPDAFEVEVFFDEMYPEERRFDEENIRQHCSPVVNLFDMDAEPIHIDGEVGEHRVVPDVASEDIATYDVTSVVGVEDASGDEHAYTRFFDFQHEEEDHQRFYTTSRRIGPSGRPDVYLSLGDAHLEALRDVPAETLSVEARCTNGTLPRRKIKKGMITQMASGEPDVARPRNLSKPTLLRSPPHQEETDFFWKLISHWSFNYQSVANRESLVGLLKLYDWRSDESNQQRMDGIQAVDWEPKDIVEKGAVLRGAEVTMKIEDGHFADEGDLCLFGLVMSRFLSMYATLNSFVHLKIVMTPSERQYEWTPSRGDQPTL